jgi:4-hydroxybenzoate polyprenyltransferase
MANETTMRKPNPVIVFLEMIRFEHTIFALPFAYLSMVLAARGLPTLRQFVWITVAMAAARTLAFAVNRWADRGLDARNLRTANRPLPRGLITPRAVMTIAGLALIVFEVAAWQLNPLCLVLSPFAIVFLVGYSYTKRFTWLSHWVLGFTDGMAGPGAWAAVTGSLAHPAPFLLWFVVTTWIAGFDLIYACQDYAVDVRDGLQSVPARFGIATALRWARINHLLTALTLAVVGVVTHLGVAYWIGWLIAAGLLAYENSIVKPDDLSRLNLAFFNVNGYISIIVFVSALLGLYF